MVFLQIWKVWRLYELLKCKHGSCGGGFDWNVNQSGLFAEILLVQWIQNFIVFFCLPPFAISYLFVTTELIFSMNLSIENFVPMEEDTPSKSFFLIFYHKRENSLDQKVLPMKVSVHVRIQLLSTLQISSLSYEFVKEKQLWTNNDMENDHFDILIKTLMFESKVQLLFFHIQSFKSLFIISTGSISHMTISIKTFSHVSLIHFFILASTVWLFNGCTTSTNFGL